MCDTPYLEVETSANVFTNLASRFKAVGIPSRNYKQALTFKVCVILGKHHVSTYGIVVEFDKETYGWLIAGLSFSYIGFSFQYENHIGQNCLSINVFRV